MISLYISQKVEKIKKLLLGVTLGVFTFTQVFGGVAVAAEARAAEFQAEAANFFVDGTNENYDLVVLVVDKEINDSSAGYVGLQRQFEDEIGVGTLDSFDTLNERIARYQEDIVENNPMTDVKILYYDKATDSVASIAKALESLYREEAGRNRLAGAVFIGDIPLPVVNKNGNKYVSMFPYTDFSDKAYIYNPENDSFERNEEVDFPKAEIWHGVIRPPEEGEAGLSRLAEFFDKNHLYYSGNAEFSEFAKRMFFADLIHEEEMVNSDVFGYYQRYLESWEDMTYMRYNKYWLNELQQTVVDDLGLEAVSGEGIDSALAEASGQFFQNLKDADTTANLPDIYTKQMIEKYLLPYFQVTAPYISKVNDMIDGTGRYSVKSSDADVLPVLISIKDEYTRQYLRSVNDKLEEEINDLAEVAAAKIPLVEYSELSGKLGDGAFSIDFSAEVGRVNEAGQAISTVYNGLQFYRFLHSLGDNLYKNGFDADLIKRAQDCSVLLGSTKTQYFDDNSDFNPKEVDGVYSIIVRALRSDNLVTGTEIFTPGVNTRLVSSEQAKEIWGVSFDTDNVDFSGAIVEDSVDGMKAFIPNPLNDGKNAWEDILQVGDVIQKVNGEKVGCYLDSQIKQYICNTFDSLVDKAVTKTQESADAQNRNLLSFEVRVEFYRLGNTSVPTKMPAKSLNFAMQKDDNKWKLKDSGNKNALFSLYDTEQGYDASGGCNMANTLLNSDRCFPLAASIPVKDPAGATALGKMEIDGEYILKFPDSINHDDDYEKISSEEYENHIDMFQFPGSYQYEDIDEVILNSCYSGLPDLNNIVGVDQFFSADAYDKVQESFEDFLKNSEKDIDEHPDKAKFMPYVDMKASDVVLHRIGNMVITLEDFAKSYGLFDGIDNDGNGVADYTWVDSDGDGLKDQKVADSNEKASHYGISADKLDEIARKMLIKDRTYIVDRPGEAKIELSVTPHFVSGNREISSVVIHNEPTSETIMAQASSAGTLSLPIDNPRYVAFIDALDQMKRIDYPNLFKGKVQAEDSLKAAAEELGETIFYPGLLKFDDSISNYNEEAAAEIKAKYNAQYGELMDKIVALQIGMNEEDIENIIGESALQVRSGALQTLKERVLLALNEKLQAILNEAEAEVSDSVSWMNMSIDDKHKYALEYYLNDERDALVADNKGGYEAAYLVMDGEENYFESYFNKNSVEESDQHFNPLSTEFYGVDDEEENEGNSVAGEDEKSGSNSVSLPQFIPEVSGFLADLAKATKPPGIGLSCVEGGRGGEDQDNKEVEKGEIDILTYKMPDRDALSKAGIDYDELGKEDLDYFIMPSINAVADGKSLIKVEAMLEDPKDSALIEFSIKSEIADIVKIQGVNRVETVDGVAVIYLLAGTKSGEFVLRAGRAGRDDITEKEMFLTAGEAAKIEVRADSSVLVANGQSKTKVHLRLLDKFNNFVADSFDNIYLFSDGNAKIDESVDKSSLIYGTQAQFEAGELSFDLMAGEVSEQVNLWAVLMNYENEENLYSTDSADFLGFLGRKPELVRAKKSFQIVDPSKLSLNFNYSSREIQAGGNDGIRLGVELYYEDRRLSQFSGPLELSSLKAGMLEFVNLSSKGSFIKDGKTEFILKAGKISGNAEVKVEIPGFISDIAKVKVLSGPPARIELSSEEEMVLNARILDKDGNLVTDDYGLYVNFSMTDATRGLAQFIRSTGSSIAKVKVSEGIASVEAKKGKGSGKVNFIASSDSPHIEKGYLTMDVKQRVLSNEVANFAPDSLYVSLLGGAFANPAVKNNLANSVLYSSGSVQAVTSVTASLNDKKRIISVDGFGKLEILDDNIESTIVTPTKTFPYQKILFSDTLSKKEVLNMFVVPKPNTPVMFDNGLSSEISEGIIVRKISDKYPDLTFLNEENQVFVKKANKVIAKIDKFGRVSLSDKDLKLEIADGKYFSLNLIYQREDVAQISFQQNFGKDVNLNFGGTAYSPGIYVSGETSGKYKFVKALSGSSSENPMGVYLVDSEEVLAIDQAPGFAQTSLENVRSNFGIGFKGENKHMLLYAAGNTIGESNIPYASEVGIVYGDPLIRLEKSDSLLTDVDIPTDIGDPVFSGNQRIQQLIDFDFNADGHKDLLIFYEDGAVRLLKNTVSNSRFTDRGEILKIYNGIFSATRIDINKDGYDDLIVGTKDGCLVGEPCISQFTNNEGHFERETLNLRVEGKIYAMAAYDMNNDGCEDLITSDSGANVRIFENRKIDGQCRGLSNNHVMSKNFGYSIDDSKNNVASLFVNYPGMDVNEGDESLIFNLSTPVAPSSFVELIGESANELESEMRNSEFAGSNIPEREYRANFQFKSVLNDNSLGIPSEKEMSDVNGEVVKVDDKIDVTIKLSNSGSSDIYGLKISDLSPETMSIDFESLECFECNDVLEWEESGMSLRSHIIKNVSVPAGGSRTIKYSMIVNQVPKVEFQIIESDLFNDEYKDILVLPEFSSEKRSIHIFSKGMNDGKVVYEKGFKNVSSGGNGDASKNAEEGIEFQKFMEGLKSEIDQAMEDENWDEMTRLSMQMAAAMPKRLKEQTKKIQAAQLADSNYDGCIDSWNGMKSSLSGGNESMGDQIANGIQATTNLLRCSGAGCLPIPYNVAFFAPGPKSPIGIASLAVPAHPVFKFPMGVVSPYLSEMPSWFRIYTSPTLSGGVGVGICSGLQPEAKGLSPCYTFALPMQALGICDLVPKLDEVNRVAKSFSGHPDVGMTTVVADGSKNAEENLDAIVGSSSFSDPDIPVSFSGGANVKIPGFPSVITNWLDNQADEIYNKLLDLPDFYLIYPDVRTMVSDASIQTAEASKIKSLNDFLRAANSIPLIRIEGKEVLLKIPSMSKAEMEKSKRELKIWVQYHERELEKVKDYWKCNESEDRKTLCDKVTFNLTALIKSVKKLSEVLDNLSNLPGEIMSWKSMEQKYANQIICYLDTIMETMGGYMKRQQVKVEAWMKAVDDLIRTFKSWKVLLDLVVEYQTSCDECKNDHFSDLGLLLQLFVAIPDPPVIPLPKLPDVVFDLSQVQTGVEIVWPDLVFKPEPFKIPPLPTITLPDVLPDVAIEVPGFNVPDWIFDLANLDLLPELPDLPPLPVINLPDLPRPPKIPKMPDVVVDLATNLKTIFKILCLLKKGVIPVPENTLATEIEALTQPSVKAQLSFMKNFAVQMPAIQYDYVEQIRVEAKSSFKIKTDFIYQAVKAGADASNLLFGRIMDQMNSYIALPFDIFQKLVDEATKNLESGLQPVIPEDESREQSQVEKELLGIVDEMNEYVATLETDFPEKITVKASEIFLDQDSPLLNRSIAEIESRIAMENLEIVGNSDSLMQIADLRDNLIAYSKGISDHDSFMPMLADENLNMLKNNFRKTASVSFEGSSAGNNETKYNLENLVAANINMDEYANVRQGVLDNPSSAISSSAASKPGFYVYVDNKSADVLNYKEEISSISHIINVDIDNDNDLDVIYVMGGDVYFKENMKNMPNYPRGDKVSNLFKNKISDYANDLPQAVTGVSSPSENNKSADISWQASKEKSIAAYEIMIREKVEDNGEFKYRYLALVNDHEDEISKSLIDEMKISDEFVLKLNDEKNPRVSLNLENGNYYTTIYAVNSEGKRSSASDSSITAPQICADEDAPFPVVNGTEFDLPLFRSLEIDASASFDASGEIVSYYLKDKKSAEIFASEDKSDPIMTVGPFTKKADLGLHEYEAVVVDSAGHSSKVDIKVNVFVPQITLAQTMSRTGIATGRTIPEVPGQNFSLFKKSFIYRSIEGEVYFAPKKAEKIGDYKTEADGGYEVKGLKKDNVYVIKNVNGEVIAEIKGDSGNIRIMKEGYEVIIDEGHFPNPSKVIIVDNNGNEMGFVYFVGDGNSDVELLSEEMEVNFEELNGVVVRDVSDSDLFEIEDFGADNSEFPGGATLIYKNENKQMLIIESSGNIIITDERILLRKKDNDHMNHPFVVEVLFGEKVVAEIYLKPIFKGGKVQVVGQNNVPFALKRTVKGGSLYRFIVEEKDFSVEADDKIKNLYEMFARKGALDNFGNNGEFALNENISRAEFTALILKILCIVPRDSAYLPYSESEAGGGYSDIIYDQDNMPWYYAYVKEASLLGLVNGYIGDNPGALPPFKADQTITFAEAVKIILAALEYKDVIDLENLPLPEGNWYSSQILAAQELTPYVKDEKYLQNNHILTRGEAANPDQTLTYKNVLLIAGRVLNMYQCENIDSDFDGMSDYCAERYNIDNATGDEDGDGLNNRLECSLGLNPRDKDTDRGGVFDGEELGFGTDPLNPLDDPRDDDNDGLTNMAEILIYKTDPNDPDTDGGGVNDGDEVKNYTNPLDGKDDRIEVLVPEAESGIYVVPADCSTCPCLSSMENKAEISEGDIFYSAIVDELGEILSKSNEVRVEKSP